MTTKIEWTRSRSKNQSFTRKCPHFRQRSRPRRSTCQKARPDQRQQPSTSSHHRSRCDWFFRISIAKLHLRSGGARQLQDHGRGGRGSATASYSFAWKVKLSVIPLRRFHFVFEKWTRPKMRVPTAPDLICGSNAHECMTRDAAPADQIRTNRYTKLCLWQLLPLALVSMCGVVSLSMCESRQLATSSH